MKPKIAIVAGGNSSENVISLQSAAGLMSFMDKDKYELYQVVLIHEDWHVVLADDEKVSIDKNDFSFSYNEQKIRFDFAYITIHGTPGEDGILQAYFDLIGLPYSTCGVLASALSFNKFTCNQYLQSFGIKVAESILLRKGQSINPKELEAKIGFPCFVKSNVGGSSFGITKVKAETEVEAAIDLAFKEGDEVMIEAFIAGTEVTCGIYKTQKKAVVLPVTEVVPHNEFFDFGAKYKGEVDEITPARISQELTERIQQLTSAIYDILNCKGIVRIDYIITEGESIKLLEVNTVPGMTATSFIPQQVAAAGMTMKEVLADVIDNELNVKF